jgi:hypothetical protein
MPQVSVGPPGSLAGRASRPSLGATKLTVGSVLEISVSLTSSLEGINKNHMYEVGTWNVEEM